MIKFELTLEDFLNFNSYHVKTHSNFIQKYYMWILLVVLYSVVFNSSFQSFAEFFDIGNLIIIVFLVIMVFLMSKLKNYTTQKNATNLVKNNPQSIGVRIIDFDDEKITLSTDVSVTDYKYSAFLRVEEDEKYYFAFLGTNTAIILPKRIQEYQELHRLVEKIRFNSKLLK
jgi:hypothetical protein